MPWTEEKSQEKLERCPASQSLEWQSGTGSFALAFAKSLWKFLSGAWDQDDGERVACGM